MNAKPKLERRRDARVRMKELQVITRGTSKVVGSLVDLSLGGMQIKSEVPMDANNIYSLRIHFEERLLDKGFFDIDTECVWCSESSKLGSYRVGFTYPFKEVDEIIFVDQIRIKYKKTNIVVG